MAQMVVEDVIDSWHYIVYGLLLSMVVSLIFIAMMRWIAGPMIWLSIAGVLAMLSYGRFSFNCTKIRNYLNIIHFRNLLQLHKVRVFEGQSQLQHRGWHKYLL